MTKIGPHISMILENIAIGKALRIKRDQTLVRQILISNQSKIFNNKMQKCCKPRPIIKKNVRKFQEIREGHLAVDRRVIAGNRG